MHFKKRCFEKNYFQFLFVQTFYIIFFLFLQKLHTIFFINFSTKSCFKKIFPKKYFCNGESFCKMKFVILPKGRSVKGRGTNTTKSRKSAFSWRSEWELLDD